MELSEPKMGKETANCVGQAEAGARVQLWSSDVLRCLSDVQEEHLNLEFRKEVWFGDKTFPLLS